MKHAKITFIDGKFILEDRNTSFGTFVSTRKPIELKQEEETIIQIRNKTFNITRC